jgi:hypothetical protein
LGNGLCGSQKPVFTASRSVVWPREAEAPLAGIPAAGKIADAYLRDQPVSGLLYGGAPKALPVARVRLRIGASVQETAVNGRDKTAVFASKLDAGSADIEATLLDPAGQPLCGGFYVTIRNSEESL